MFLISPCDITQRICLITTLVFVSTTNVCIAQEETGEQDSTRYDLEEVTVVGTRAVEKIIDIPYSVFKVDKRELALGKKVSAKDVLADVPGLFLQSRYGNHDLRISIRGFGTRSSSGVRGIRILQDGVPESEPDGETVIDAVDFTSLGGVEVIKGNLSSLYANAPGGVINFISDLYFPDNYVSWVNQTGKFGLQQNGFRLGLKNDESRFLFSYHYRNLDGYREHSAEYQHLVNTVYETYLPNSTLTILGNFVNGLIKLPGSLTQEEYNEDPFQAYLDAVSQDFRRITKKGRLAIKLQTGFSEDQSNQFGLTAYGGIKELERASNRSYTLATRYSVGGLAHLTNKTRILDRLNTLTVGMDYGFQGGPIKEFDNITGVPVVFAITNDYSGSLSNVGFYFLDHYSIVPERFDVFASGRFDRNVFKRNVYIPFGKIDTTRTFQKFTPKIAFNYKIIPSIALYTSYGLSYDFPALSEMSNTPLTSNTRSSLNPDLDAQTSRNFELGIKGNIVNRQTAFMRKVFFEMTFFKYVIEDEIVPFVLSQQTYFRNVARTNRIGVEVGIKSEPVKEVEVTANYTYTRFAYDRYLATIHDPTKPDTVVDYSGNVVPSVPKHIINLILNYEYEISENLSGLLQWDCDFISQMYVNDSNSDRVSSYFYGNAMAGINVSFKPITIVTYFGINNIFDKRYVSFISINDSQRRFLETGEPRNFYAGLRINFTY